MFITKYLLLLNKKKPNSGFTLIESLIAIIVVSLLMTMIAPILAFSVGTRVQSKRVETATQAANNYIQGLKSGAIPVPNYVVTVNNYTVNITTGAKTYTDTNRYLISNMAPPSSTLLTSTNCTATTVTTNSGYCQNAAATAPSTSTVSLYCVPLDDVDLDAITTNDTGCTNGSYKDMIIQAVRSVYESTPGTASTVVNDPTKGYLVGLRVYRGDAFTANSTLTGSCQISGNTACKTNATQSTVTAGLGSRTAPLVEITADIPPTGAVNYTNFCDRLTCQK